MEITLVPHAGLCNRICAITSGALYAQHNPDIKMRILWNKTRDCCAKFSDLFKQPESIKIEELRGLINYPAGKRNLYLPHLLRLFYYDKIINDGFGQRDHFEESVKGKDRVYVYSYSHFNQYCLRESLANFLRPTEELQQRIDSEISTWGGHNIGIHVRRTDNVPAAQNSTLEKYFRAMDLEIKKYPDCCFYVASDDESVKDEMRVKYGDRINTLNLCLERNSVQGMKDAVVELWLLASTSKILGSFYSSYSMVASWLYNIELEIIK